MEERRWSQVVKTEGGMVPKFLATPASAARFDADGKTSSTTSDILQYAPRVESRRCLGR